MASWKKVIVSGSNANLTLLSVDNLTSGQVVIGGGSGSNLTTTAINGTGSIVATTGASGLSHSGSFSGSFQGTISGGNAFVQDGNSFGTTAVLGTNDNQSLQFETSGNVRMYISSSGNVGIGNNEPNVALDVSGEIAIRGAEDADDARMYFRAADNSNRFTIETDIDINNTLDKLGFRSTFADNILVLGGDGNVAMGSTGSYKPYSHNGDLTTIPKLDVFASGSIPLTIRTTNQNSDHVLFTSMDTNTKWWMALSGNDFRIYNTASVENILLGVDGSSVDTGNKVGIGIASPTARLSVSGNIDLTSSVSTAINIQSGAGVKTYIASDGGGTAFGSLSNHAVYFTQNNIERARIDVGGNFGIGKVSPNARLDVSGSAIITGSLTVTGGITGSITASGVFGPYGANSVISSSYAVNAGKVNNALTAGKGITSFTYDGSSPISIQVTGSNTLTTNVITKWNGTAFSDTSLIDNFVTVTGASSIQLTGANSSLTGSFTGSFRGDGSGLTGLATTLSVSASLYAGHPIPTSGSVSLISQGLSIQGTSNEIEAVVSGQTVTIGLPNDVAILNQLTVGGDLIVNGTTTTVNTTDLYIEDKFIILASGSANNNDGGIIIDRGAYGNGNIAYGFDSATGRWGYQNGLTDTTNVLDPTGTGTSGAFAGIVFTEVAHTSTKPTTGEFVMAGAIYTNTDGTIWMFS